MDSASVNKLGIFKGYVVLYI